MRIAIGWTKLSGYMTACWRELVNRPGVEFTAVLSAPRGLFDERLLDGIPHRLVDADDLYQGRIRDEVCGHLLDFKPDLLIMAGWFVKSYKPILADPPGGDTRLVMTMDNPWRDTPRQRLGARAVRRTLRPFDAIFCPGERAFQFALRLGMPPSRIFRGLYCADVDSLLPLHEQRIAKAGSWPRAFVYMGRYSPEKGIDTLLEAYARYREAVDDPWPLHACGAGPLKDLWKDRPGVTDHGFVQPADQKNIWLDAAAMLFPSTYEPWGVAALEAAASGLPIVCSHECGAAVEILRPLDNGLYFQAGDPESLDRCLRWLHEHHDLLPAMGRRAQDSAAPFRAQRWADRVLYMAEQIRSQPKRCS